MSWEDKGTTPKDMDCQEGKNGAARAVFAAIGVPAMLLIHGKSTCSNRAEANPERYERTVLPLIGQLVDGLNASLCPRFGEGLRLGVDGNVIPAMAPRREIRRKSAPGPVYSLWRLCPDRC